MKDYLIRSIVCEYKHNPLRNEEVIANVIVFLQVFDLEKGQPEGQGQVYAW